MVIALERAYDQGSAVLETLNEVQAHLARASFVAARLQLERAQAPPRHSLCLAFLRWCSRIMERSSVLIS
jgi:hypothetical protein